MKKNSYNTLTRSAIDGIFVGNKDKSYSVSEILSILHEIGIVANKTTIYRYVSSLCENNVLLKFVAEKGEKTLYKYNDKNLGCDNHLHLKCSSCGEIEHLGCNDMEEFKSHILKEHGFLLNCSSSLLYGLCKKCSRGNKGKI